MAQLSLRKAEREFLVALAREAEYRLDAFVDHYEIGEQLGLEQSQVRSFIRSFSDRGLLENVAVGAVSLSYEAVDLADQWEAASLLSQISEAYLHSKGGDDVIQLEGENGNFRSGQRPAESLVELGLLESVGERRYRITDAGKRHVRGTGTEASPSGVSIQNNVTINAPVAALAVGQTATATTTQGLTQERFRQDLDAAMQALVRDQDALEQIDSRLYEALNQFLRTARKLEIDVDSLGDVQRKMKETLDEVWSAHSVDGLRSKALPATLEVVKALASSPFLSAVVAGLAGA